MGLSPGKDKKRVAAQEAATTQAIQAVAAPDPLAERIKKRATDVLDWQDSKNPNKNILDLPGISDQMDIYGNAENVANQELMGSGAGQLANPADGALQTQLRELSKNQRFNTRAAGLSDAASAIKNQALGIADSAVDRDMTRRLQAANLNLGNQAQLYNRYKKQNPWYQKLWNAGLQAASVGSRF